jgi:hypothetical protein
MNVLLLPYYWITNMSPDAGAVVNEDTVKTPPDVDAVISQPCPLKFAVAVSSVNLSINPLN